MNTNSEGFKKIFFGSAAAADGRERDVRHHFDGFRYEIVFFRDAVYSDDEEIEARIFHLAREFDVRLFEKDPMAEKCIENLNRVCDWKGLKG